MPNDQKGPQGPMPIPPRRRPAPKPDPRLLIVHRAVMAQGFAYNPDALAEETGLPADAIRRFAAQIVVDRDMVDLGMIEAEDAIRMGSMALAASLRILGATHQEGRAERPTIRPMPSAKLIGMRRVAHRLAQAARPVTPCATHCPNCGARTGGQSVAHHQCLLMPAPTPDQGRPHA